MIWDLAEKWKWEKIGVNDTVFYRTKVMVPMINYCMGEQPTNYVMITLDLNPFFSDDFFICEKLRNWREHHRCIPY